MQQAETNGKSIAALVLGILSLLIPWVGIILGIIGIILARLSLNEIKENNQNGKGMAIAGLTTSIICLSIYALIVILLFLVGGLASIS